MEDETPRGRASPKRARALKRKFSDSGLEEGTRVNPFKDHLLRNLNQPIWSPTTLVEFESPPQKTWAIEQMAVLYPCNIEESPSSHQEEDFLSDEAEEKIQKDIMNFFHKDLSLPTPPKNIETEQFRNDNSPGESRVTNSRKSSQGMATLLGGFKFDDTLPLEPSSDNEKENALELSLDSPESPLVPIENPIPDGALLLTPDSNDNGPARTPTDSEFEWKIPLNRLQRSSPDLTPIRRNPSGSASTPCSIESPQSPQLSNDLKPHQELQ